PIRLVIQRVQRSMLVPHRLVAIVQQDTFGRAVQILVLPVMERPEKGGQAQKAEQDGDGNKNDEVAHRPTVATAFAGGGPHSFLLRSPRSLGSAAEKGITANLANGFVSVPRCVAQQGEDDDEPDQA